jgi:hypothetical protein
VRSAVLRSVRKALPCLPEVPPSGFGYPPGGVSAPRSVEASFSSRRPWASPFRAFILPGDREEGFPSSPSAPALSRQTFPAWRWSSGGLIPPRKPCPLLLPWMFTPGRGLVLSWASRPFGLSRPKNRSRGLSPRISPLPFFPPNGLAAERERNLKGLRLFGPGISLRGGRRPVWPFPPTILRCPLGSPPAAGYFFTSGTRTPSRKPKLPSQQPTSFRLTEGSAPVSVPLAAIHPAPKLGRAT